jgi:hypothetical protein
MARELGHGERDESENWFAVTAEVGGILDRLLGSRPKRIRFPADHWPPITS